MSDKNAPHSPQLELDTLRESHRRPSSASFPSTNADYATGHTAEVPITAYEADLTNVHQAWLKGAGASTSRFISMFIEVLRLLAVHKLCIWCLEDVQFADAESSELIQRVVAARIPLVLIFTYR